MNAPPPPGDTQRLAASIIVWLQLLVLAVGVLHFTFAPNAVPHPLLAAGALALLAVSTLLVHTVPLLQQPRARQLTIDIFALLLCITLLAAATGAAGSALLPLYLIPLTSTALAFGRWWLVLLLAAMVAALVFALGLLTPDITTGSPEFGVQLLSALAPGAAVAIILAGLIEQIRADAQHINALASIDSLTGLLNLHAFEEVLQQQHHSAERFGRPYTLLIIDVDNLAQVNELLGHKAGSQVLGGVASAISRSIRNSDVAARLGGDDFVVLLVEADAAAAAGIAKCIRNNVYAGTVLVANRLVRTNVSVGLATFPGDHLHPRELMILADQRMQQDQALRRPSAA